MQLCSGAVSVHYREDICQDGESVQFMAVNPSGTTLAVLTQLRVHFWSAGPKVVYLTSLAVPGTSLEDNPAMYVLWRQRPGSHLAVITARHVAFYEADINLRSSEFLQTIERKGQAMYMHHVDSASRVCYSSEVPIVTGLATSAVAAGPYAFLVTTTAGVVYVLGWHQQGILHQWTTVGLQGGGHTFWGITNEEGSNIVTAAVDDSALATTGTTLANSSLSLTAMRLSMPSTWSLSRPDPLQRRCQQGLRVPSSEAIGDSTTSPAAAASAPALIPPPGTAVRRFATPFDSNGNATTSPPLPDGEATKTAGPSEVDTNAKEPTADEQNVCANTSVNIKSQRLRQHSHLLSSFSATDAADAHRSTGAELLSGTILHASFASGWKVLSFVFTSGSVLLCRTSCGTNFTHQVVQLQGCVTPIISACMVAINVRHLLLAVCTQAGAISCRRIDGTSLAVHPNPLWKGLRGLSDAVSKYPSGVPCASKSLGLIAGMEWSPSEELLCVAFYRHGMALVHYSGVVVTRHLSGPSTATLLRTPQVPAMDSQLALDDETAVMGETAQPPPSSNAQKRVASLGCSAISWKPDGTRLWMAAPRQPYFFSTQLSRVLTVDTVGPTFGHHSPLALLADNALYLVSLSEAATSEGVCEMVLVPDSYLRVQYPLLYGAVSSDGSWITCAGRRGLALFNRERYSWKLPSKEESFSCIADPVWLCDVAVAVPALRTDSRTFELVVLTTSSVSLSHASACVALDSRPTQLSCIHQDQRGEGYVVVVDFNQVVRVFRYNVFTDVLTRPSSAKPYVTLTPVQQLALPNELSNPLQVIPVFLRDEEDDREAPQRTEEQMGLRLILHKRSDHTLVWLRGELGTAGDAASGFASSTGSLPHVSAVAEPIDPTNHFFLFRCWVDRTAPVRGTVLLAHLEEQGLVMYQLQLSSRRSTTMVAPVAHRIEVAATRDLELLPLCPSPFDGYMLCVATDMSAPRPSHQHCAAGVIGGVNQASPRPQLALRPILYAHRILSLLLLEAMPSSLVPPRVFSTQDVSASSFAARTISRQSSRFEGGATCAVATASAISSSHAAEVDDRVVTFMWDRNFFHWLEYMRLNDTFSAVFDYFLHTALNDSPPAAVQGLARRSAVRATIALLRNYPEFYAIVVGCMRKMDFTRWRLVLDFLGTPTDLFHECVAHYCYAEAVHLIRVIMMGTYKPVATLSVNRVAELGSSGCAASDITPLQQASQCAVELFVLSVENGNYTAAYDIMRFMARLEEEIGMPPTGGVDLHDGSGGGAGGSANSSDSFLTRWLRQLTFGGTAHFDAEAAVEGPTGTALSGKAKAKGGSSSGAVTMTHWVEGFPTLVFDITRCDPARSGRAAEEAAEEVQRQTTVHHMFRRHHALPEAVHQEALRLLRTGYVLQLTRLMETFSFSVAGFLQAVHPIFAAAAATTDVNDAGEGEVRCDSVRVCLHDIFDGLHKELGLPRSFAVNVGPTVNTMWSAWVMEQRTAQAAALPGVLSSTNPRVWTVAQSVLYASPSFLRSVEALHQLFSPIFVVDLAFCVVLMHKSNLISLLLSRETSTDAHAGQPEDVATDSGAGSSVSPMKLIDALGQLDALLAVPENTGYRPFLQDVFTSLPPSILHAIAPPVSPCAGVVASSSRNDATSTGATE
ncbi:RIC1 [Leishmania braziliensis]|nr:RIC1 [Leishmania braziliensis]